MSRQYRIPFSGVVVAAPQDLLQITGATGKMVRVIKCWAGATDTTAPTNQQLQFRCRLLPATVTNGSGGTTPAIVPSDGGDAAASFTALANNTTKATTTGTVRVLHEGGDNVFAGTDIPFPDRPPIASGQAFVFELLSTPSGTLHLSGGALVEEIGG